MTWVVCQHLTPDIALGGSGVGIAYNGQELMPGVGVYQRNRRSQNSQI
jgi:hypothetical protein